jgi:hypothetical protein
MLGARPHTLLDSNGKFRIIDLRIGTSILEPDSGSKLENSELEDEMG